MEKLSEGPDGEGGTGWLRVTKSYIGERGTKEKGKR